MVDSSPPPPFYKLLFIQLSTCFVLKVSPFTLTPDTNITVGILPTYLFTFPKMLTGRIC